MSRDRTANALRRVDSLQALPTDELADLANASVLRSVPARRRVALRADRPVAQFVVFGLVRLYHRAPGGLEVAVARVEPGQVLDAGFLLPGRAVGLRADAETDATLCCVDAGRLRGTLARHPAALLRLVRQIGERLLAVEEKLDEQVGTGAPARVATALLRVAREEGRTLPDGQQLVEGVNQQALAREAGVSRETVSRVLGRLRSGGLLLRDGRRYLLPRPGRLAEQVTGL
jgi:CRP/FNR family cyclic AMP-dependent transcriptional regulator